MRRTCAKLCHGSGGELEQIQFLLGHASVQTTERLIFRMPLRSPEEVRAVKLFRNHPIESAGTKLGQPVARRLVIAHRRREPNLLLFFELSEQFFQSPPSAHSATAQSATFPLITSRSKIRYDAGVSFDSFRIRLSAG